MSIDSNIKQSALNKIADYYQLGEIIKKPSPLKGGLLHRQWKFMTCHGEYVIKQLNPEVIKKPNAANRYKISEKISKEYSKHIYAVNAITVDNDPLFATDHHTFMLFPYIDAVILNQDEIAMNHVIKISDALAIMHESQIKVDNPPDVEDIIIDPSEFNELAKKLQTVQPSLASTLLNASKCLISIIEGYNKYKSLLTTNIIISHRDLDVKNVIWDDNNQYYIIDWESAGFINRTFDLLSTAIYWSINSEYKINMNYYHLFIQTYLNKSPIIVDKDQLKAAFLALLATWINWLNFNCNRILNNDKNSSEYSLAVKESISTLTAVERIFLQKKSILLDG